MNQMRMDDEKSKIFRNMIKAMAEFRNTFSRDIDTSFAAELYAAEQLGLTLNPSSKTKGFDGIDTNGKRYQIKYRAASTQNVDINNFDFDYIVLVNLDDNYKLRGMWLCEAEEVKKLSVFRPRFRKYQALQNKLKSSAQQIV